MASIPNGNFSNRSGVISAPNESEDILPHGGDRSFLMLRNPANAPGPLWVNFTQGGASNNPLGGSVPMQAGEQFVFETFVPENAISVFTQVTDADHVFVCIEA